MAQVKVKGKDIGYVSDYLCECPEDAIWDRRLSDIFWKGVEAGLKADTRSDIEVVDVNQGEYDY